MQDDSFSTFKEVCAVAFNDLFSCKDKYCLRNNNTMTRFFHVETFLLPMKKEIRRAMRSKNRSLEEDLRQRMSERIFLNIEALPQFREASCVAFFASLEDEPDTQPWLHRWAESKRLVLPKVEDEQMEFYDYSPSQMQTGAFGIEEPKSSQRRCAEEEIDLMIVPGVAFTLRGNRLGRGKGFYDRYLSRAGVRAYKIGVCYPHQILPEGELPTFEHDVKMDFIVTCSAIE